MRWKEAQPLQPTAVIVSSSDAKDVARLTRHTFQLPHMSLCAKRLLDLMAVLALSQI